MARHFKGELIYNQEVDEHLPYLTVGQTLEFTAAMRTPRARPPHITRKDRIKHVVEVMLSVFGLSHTRNTIVGNGYVRGVSGGERKRVSIAETALTEAAISAWDNSTCGLDAESALHFVCRLRTLSDYRQSMLSILEEIEQYQKDFSSKWEATQREFESTRHKLKAKGMLHRASQTVSFPIQTAICARRATQQLWNDKGSTLTTLIGEIVIALVVGSVFYGTPETSDAFFSYGSVLSFSVLLNVLMSMTDTHNLYKGRSVVRKQA
ncbi:hypothetical protein BFJ69_g16769 [Fusarium oxysporum]|uniref:Uncharacterized protein n=1 Tax=Fusarium oxysporum TaxID=5507 RepID=A0A420MA64_FUSOX|nr:hypothetical protein BFJ69_g16769 [Fusarium oxysporum]